METAMNKYKHLFAPIVLANVQFKNRILAAPIGLEYYPDERLHPGDDFIAYFERKARGGAASVCVGSAMADNARGAVGPTIRLDDPSALAPLYRLSQCITRHGAVADIELQHCGANAYHSMLALGNEIFGAVDTVNGLGMEIRAMPEAVILETIERFGDAAQTAKHVGFGMVTIHAGHGWLLNQFLAPRNNRKDGWGSTMANRARIVNAIADNIKRKCGRAFPVNVRISGAELVDGGYDIDYGIEIAKALDGHFDMINVSVGAHEAPPVVFTHTHPSMFLADGVNVKYAAEVKKAVKESKVAAVGALADPDYMEEIIASGQADVVMVCRGLIADPDLPAKAQQGKVSKIRKCIRCFECFSAQFTKLYNLCAINPEIGFERESRYGAYFPLKKKRVAVIGGGVAGMQAALAGAKRGHEIVLIEKEAELGGILRCERRVPFKRNLQKYLDQQARLIADNPAIDLRLSTEATPSLVTGLDVDVVIAAVGARAVTLNIPGLDGSNVLSVEYAFMHADELGENVLVLGGGLSGIEAAVYFSGLGKRVSIIEMANNLNFSGNLVHSMALHGEIEKFGISVITSTKVVGIDAAGVIGEFVGNEFSPAPLAETITKGMLQSVLTLDSSGWGEDVKVGDRNHYHADTVVYAFGTEARRSLADSLRVGNAVFYSVGDCWDVKNIYAANATAFTIAQDIGSQ